MRVARSASGDGLSFRFASSAKMKLSTVVRANVLPERAGIGGRLIGRKAQCCVTFVADGPLHAEYENASASASIPQRNRFLFGQAIMVTVSMPSLTNLSQRKFRASKRSTLYGAIDQPDLAREAATKYKNRAFKPQRHEDRRGFVPVISAVIVSLRFSCVAYLARLP